MLWNTQTARQSSCSVCSAMTNLTNLHAFMFIWNMTAHTHWHMCIYATQNAVLGKWYILDTSFGVRAKPPKGWCYLKIWHIRQKRRGEGAESKVLQCIHRCYLLQKIQLPYSLSSYRAIETLPQTPMCHIREPGFDIWFWCWAQFPARADQQGWLI